MGLINSLHFSTINGFISHFKNVGFIAKGQIPLNYETEHCYAQTEVNMSRTDYCGHNCLSGLQKLFMEDIYRFLLIR